MTFETREVTLSFKGKDFYDSRTWGKLAVVTDDGIVEVYGTAEEVIKVDFNNHTVRAVIRYDGYGMEF